MQTPDHRGRVPHRVNARGERYCNTCRRFLPLDQFRVIRKWPQATCRPCQNERSRRNLLRRCLADPTLADRLQAAHSERRRQRKNTPQKQADQRELVVLYLTSRRSMGLTWREIADECDVSRKGLSDIHHGRTTVLKTSTFEKIMGAATRIP